MNSDVELVGEIKAAHGEGPVWHAEEGIVYWVDITGCAINAVDPVTGRERTIPVGHTVGAVAPRRGGGLVAALANGFAFVDTESGQVTPICDPEAELEGNRFNDGKGGPGGRFWAGSCSENCDVPGAGSLYCLEPDLSVRKELGDLTIANGLAWTSDGHTFYYIDTPTFEVWAFDFDPASGTLANRRTAVSIPEDLGFPDGMTIDAEGMLWVALWGGACVSRWNPHTGERLGSVPLPVEKQVLSIFAGTSGSVDKIPKSEVSVWEVEMFRYFEDRHPKLLGRVKEEGTRGKLGDALLAEIKKAFAEFNEVFTAEKD